MIRSFKYNDDRIVCHSYGFKNRPIKQEFTGQADSRAVTVGGIVDRKYVETIVCIVLLAEEGNQVASPGDLCRGCLLWDMRC